MKFLHISDLHLGKKVEQYDLIEDQEHILGQIAEIAQAEKPDAILIAGDIFDRSVPSEEAVHLWDRFLGDLAADAIPIYVVPGNHDSAVRVSFGAGLLHNSGLHIAAPCTGSPEVFTLSDSFGEARIYLLPFTSRRAARDLFPEESDEIKTYTDAVRRVLGTHPPDPAVRSVLVAHQYVTGDEDPCRRCDSEDVIGGVDNVDLSIFSDFDYVALGHLHRPQKVGNRPEVRYCGTPLKYSRSEKDDTKSVTVVTLAQKGQVDIQTRPLIPLHDRREIRGQFQQILDEAKGIDEARRCDYVYVVLTDEIEQPGAIEQLRTCYPNLAGLSYDNQRTRTESIIDIPENVQSRSIREIFEELFQTQNGKTFTDQQREFLETLIAELGKEGETA
ncbi:MAG: exonuclease SbcCD subunit D [Thermoguttaceae bacterium]|nr:exonuclease SbcCD subunit D [Thermoguttaceae bacterium]